LRYATHFEAGKGCRCHLQYLFQQAGRELAEAVAATMSVLHPHQVMLPGPGPQAFDMMREAGGAASPGDVAVAAQVWLDHFAEKHWSG